MHEDSPRSRKWHEGHGSSTSKGRAGGVAGGNQRENEPGRRRSESPLRRECAMIAQAVGQTCSPTTGESHSPVVHELWVLVVGGSNPSSPTHLSKSTGNTARTRRVWPRCPPVAQVGGGGASALSRASRWPPQGHPSSHAGAWGRMRLRRRARARASLTVGRVIRTDQPDGSFLEGRSDRVARTSVRRQ